MQNPFLSLELGELDCPHDACRQSLTSAPWVSSALDVSILSIILNWQLSKTRSRIESAWASQQKTFAEFLMCNLPACM